MTKTTDFQLYIDKLLSNKDLTDFIREQFNCPVLTLDTISENVNDFVFIDFEKFTYGFKLGLGISGKGHSIESTSEIDFSKKLAQVFDTKVAIGPDESSEDFNNPFIWVLIIPNEGVFRVKENLSADHLDGLILDEGSKIPVRFQKSDEGDLEVNR